MYLRLANTFFHTFLIFISVLYTDRTSTVKAEDVLDTKYPILISENHEPLSRSYFGYTVSLAQGKNPPTQKYSLDVDGWVFIGAPKANASSSYYADNAVEPGVVWRCSLGRQNGVDSCEIMNVDPDPTPATRQTTIESAPHGESHNGAFIGGALEVNHNHFLTCGWRWNRGKQQFYNGICYWFADSNKTSRVSHLSNDLSNLVNKTTYDQRLTPFYATPQNKDRLFNFTNSKNEIGSAHEWQVSLLGLSTHLFLDDMNQEESLPNLLIGAAGVRESSGAVVLYTNTITPKETQASRANRNKTDPTFSQFVVGNRAPIPTIGATRTYWDEYFGYSVTSGRYMNKDKIHYASGAPRAHHTGEVVIFDIPPPNAQQPTTSYKRLIQPVLEIKAPENSFGSYFGSVLYSVDLDENGLDELVVGAPMHTFRSDKITLKEKRDADIKAEKFVISAEYGDHGCVFVYNFTKSKGNPKQSYSIQTLFGSKTSRAQFGSAISSIKFEYASEKKEIYLVIGAPYEQSNEESESSGAIYLYKYNAKLGKYGELSQKIVASQFSTSLKGFGCSVSKTEDIDFNRTPDIAIGAYKSGQAVILRTRPKVLIKSWIKFTSQRKEIKQIRRRVKSFFLKSCFSMTIDLGKVEVQMDFWVKVKFSDPTIRFRDSRVTGNKRNEIVYVMEKVPTHDENCEDLVIEAVHKDGIGMDDSDELKEILAPLHFTQEVWYNDTLNQPLSVLNYSATSTGASQPSNINFLSFNSGQPSAQTAKTSADLPIQPNDCGDKCIPDLSVASWSFNNDKNERISSYTLGSSKLIKLKIVIANTGETAIKPRLVLDWDNVHVKESESGTRWLSENCKYDDSDKNSAIYRCDLGQHIQNGRNRTIDIDLNMAQVYAKQQQNYELNLNGAVSVKDDSITPKTGRTKLTFVVPPTVVWIAGSREPDDTLQTPMEYNISVLEFSSSTTPVMTLYSPFSLDFNTRVLGSSVGSLTAQFKIPIHDEGDANSKKPLFLVVEPEMDPPNWAKCTSRLGFHQVELLNSKNALPNSNNQPQKRQKNRKLLNPPLEIRAVVTDSEDQNEMGQDDSSAIAIDMKPPVKPSKWNRLNASNEALTLSCADEEASCMEISCTAINIKANSHYHIQFDLYPIKDAIDEIIKGSGKPSILVEGKGYAHIFNSGHLHQDDDIAQTRLSKVGKSVESWVYIVAGIGGLLALLLIIFILYKCGFFKREKLQQLNQMKAEHHRKSMMVRASMLPPSSPGMDDESFGSQDILADAEHHNEDTEPEQIPTELLKDEKE